jgi:hypothetical protein
VSYAPAPPNARTRTKSTEHETQRSKGSLVLHFQILQNLTEYERWGWWVLLERQSSLVIHQTTAISSNSIVASNNRWFLFLTCTVPTVPVYGSISRT